MRTRSRRNGIKKVTALVPKTLKAAKGVSSAILTKIDYFLKKGFKTVKNVSRATDRRVAKTIRRFTKRRSRR